MSLVKRFLDTLRGKAEAALDQLESPEEQLSVVVDNLNQQVQSLQQAVATALTDEKRLRMQIEDSLNKAGEWESRAILALDQHDENLAKEALTRKGDCESQSLALQKQWEIQKEATEKLKSSLQTAKTRVNEARTQYTLLLSQYKAAAAKKKLQETLTAQGPDSASQVIERLGDKIRRIEAETEAAAELEGATGSADLEARFAEIERRKRGDEALDLLKKKLADQGSATRAIPDRQGSDTVDRLEALKAKLKQ